MPRNLNSNYLDYENLQKSIKKESYPQIITAIQKILTGNELCTLCCQLKQPIQTAIEKV